MKNGNPVEVLIHEFTVELYSCYLKDGLVYVPTLARREREPVYTDIEPVGVAPVANTEAVRRTLLDTIARKNPTIPAPDRKARDAPSIILKYAGVRSWSAFYRNASTWSIGEDDGVYKIIGYCKHSKGYGSKTSSSKSSFRLGQLSMMSSTA
jgi:hypothetical protein